jgi:hypothetical protein
MPAVHDEIDKLPVAEDTKQLLYELIKRKDKVDNLKRRNYILAALNLGIASVILFWLYRINSISSHATLDSIRYLGQSQASLLFILTAVTSFILSGATSREHKKQKQKYDDLREEAMTRLLAKWEITEDSKLRDTISRLLYDHNEINIRHVK